MIEKLIIKAKILVTDQGDTLNGLWVGNEGMTESVIQHDMEIRRILAEKINEIIEVLNVSAYAAK